MPAQLYPWDFWFKKRSFRLIRGRHFTVDPYVMAQQIRNRAGKLGLLVNIKVEDGAVQVSNVRAA